MVTHTSTSKSVITHNVNFVVPGVTVYGQLSVKSVQYAQTENGDLSVTMQIIEEYENTTPTKVESNSVSEEEPLID